MLNFLQQCFGWLLFLAQIKRRDIIKNLECISIVINCRRNDAKLRYERDQAKTTHRYKEPHMVLHSFVTLEVQYIWKHVQS